MSDSLRVLIADDEALHNLALTSQLETLGHQVVATASNGREAVELARGTWSVTATDGQEIDDPLARGDGELEPQRPVDDGLDGAWTAARCRPQR